MKIAVYCGSSCGNEEKYAQSARRLGAWIGMHGHTLVFGGGDAGLMGETAKAARENGADVIGVVPKNVLFICDRPQPYCTEVIRMENIHTRKQKMLELGDAYIALPGGVGTMDEITEAITLGSIGVHDKPIIFFNTDNYYAAFREMMEKMQQAGFMGPDGMKRILFSEDPEEIGAFIAR